MRFVFRLVIRRIEVIDAGAQAGVHDGKVLIGQRQIHDDVGAETFKERDELLHIVGIDLRGLYGRISDSFHYGVALGEGAAGYHDVGKDVGVLRHFVGGYGGYAAGADDKDFSHFFCSSFFRFSMKGQR